MALRRSQAVMASAAPPALQSVNKRVTTCRQAFDTVGQSSEDLNLCCRDDEPQAADRAEDEARPRTLRRLTRHRLMKSPLEELQPATPEKVCRRATHAGGV